jgi:hypothetical protein
VARVCCFGTVVLGAAVLRKPLHAVAPAVLPAQSCSVERSRCSVGSGASRCVVVRSCASAVTLRRQRRRLPFCANRRSVQVALCRTTAVPFWVWLRITRRSSGRPTAAAQLYVSRHGREQVACAAPSSAVAHCLSRSAESARGRRAQRAGMAVRPTAARAPVGVRHRCRVTVAQGCLSVGGQRTAVLGPAAQCERVRSVRRTATHEHSSLHALGGLPRPCEYAAPALHLFFRHGRHRPCGPCRRLLRQRWSRANGR